jgi:hypothetical protein
MQTNKSTDLSFTSPPSLVMSNNRQKSSVLHSSGVKAQVKIEDKKEISEATKIYIIEKLIEPSYKNDINSMIKGKTCWRKTGMTFETMSKLMVAVGGVLSFSSGYFNSPLLSFISGSVSTISLACLQFSSFSYIQNKKQSEQLNVLLKTLDLDIVPVQLLFDDGSNTTANNNNNNKNNDENNDESNER